MLLLLLACSPPDPAGTGGDTPTWYADVAPIVMTRCANCHVDGGITPFALDTYGDVAERASQVRAAVEDDVMPPWPPADDCREYEASRALTDAEKATLLAWLDAGAPQGDAATAAPIPEATGGLSRVDLTVTMPVTYTPQTEPDDYRCFLMDWPEGDAYVTGMRAIPGETAVVHHVILYAVPPDEAEEYRALESDDAAPGYPCFGGPGGTGASDAAWLGGWAPGSQGTDFPEGTGIFVEDGSALILQLHYNTDAAGALPDRTSVELSLAESVEHPASILKLTNPAWVAGVGMDIPAGDADATASFTTPPSTQSGWLWAAALHLHQLGTSGDVRMTRASGADECLLDIPDWDFHWQGSYRFAEPVAIDPGDTLSLGCHWDNSAGTTDVAWGEGTADEMCLGVLYASAR